VAGVEERRTGLEPATSSLGSSARAGGIPQRIRACGPASRAVGALWEQFGAYERGPVAREEVRVGELRGRRLGASTEPLATPRCRSRSADHAFDNRMSPTPERMLTTAQAASALGVHERTVRRYLEAGTLTSQKLPGGHHRIPESAILNLWSGTSRGVGAKPRVAGAAHATRDKRRRRSAALRTGAPTALTVPYDLSGGSLAAVRSRFSETLAFSRSSGTARHDG
jgi:excisionase family DNA binding protein